MSEEPEVPGPEGAPKPIELEPKPRVVRLNRRAVFVAGGLATAVVLAAVFTLSDRSRRMAERRETASAVSATPDRFWEGQSDGVPRLAVEPVPLREPEVPVEKKPPVLGGGAPVLFQPEDDAADRTLRRAFTSRPIVFEGRAQVATAVSGSAGQASGTAPPFDPSDVLRAAQDLYQAEGSQGDAMVTQNLQREKLEFLRTSDLAADEEILDRRVRPSLSPFEVKAGSVIPALLITEANSDLPGQLIAQVRENVFDTATGAHLLLPQGTRAIGMYDSLVAFGQERVLVAWQRLIFPDGSSLNLGSMPGIDLAGAAGFRDRVQRDYFRVFGSAVLLSAISAGIQISQGTFDNDNQSTDNGDLREILAAGLGQNLGELATEMARRNMNVQPTLEIRSGYRFNIAVMKDLVMPGPYQAF